ncbi:hypothetical protein BGZ65_010506, partial [Modicella reniformis]
PDWTELARNHVSSVKHNHSNLTSAYSEVMDRSPVFNLDETLRILVKNGLSVELDPVEIASTIPF